MAIACNQIPIHAFCLICAWQGRARWTKAWADIDAKLHEFSHTHPELKPTACFPQWLIDYAAGGEEDVTPQELNDIWRLHRISFERWQNLGLEISAKVLARMTKGKE